MTTPPPDIVERLRARASEAPSPTWNLLNEAIAEIARLRERCRVLAEECNAWRMPPEGVRPGTNRRIAIADARAATDAARALEDR